MSIPRAVQWTTFDIGHPYEVLEARIKRALDEQPSHDLGAIAPEFLGKKPFVSKGFAQPSIKSSATRSSLLPSSNLHACRVTGSLLADEEELPPQASAQSSLADYTPEKTGASSFGKKHLSNDPFWPLPAKAAIPKPQSADHNLWVAGPVVVKETNSILQHSAQCPLYSHV